MSQTEITGSIEPQAQPVMVKVDVPQVVLDTKLDEYWESVKDRLSPDLVKKAKRGGYRKVDRTKVIKIAGGPSAFYQPALCGLITEFVENKHNTGVLAFTNVVLSNSSIISTLYLEPKVVWNNPGNLPGTSSKIKVKAQNVTEEVVKTHVENSLKLIQENNVVLVPSTSPVELGNSVDIEISIDGAKPVPTQVLVEDRPDDHLFATLVGMVPGETRAYDDANTVKVNRIHVRDIPAIDDDLAKTAGFMSLNDIRSQLTHRTKKDLQEQFDTSVDLQLVEALAKECVIDPLPFVWLESRSKAIYDQQRSLVNTEAELLNKFKMVAQTKEQLLQFFAMKAAQGFIHDIVARSWGMNTRVPGDTSLKNIGKYVDDVVVVLRNNMELEE